jgi:hypothetical protein
MLKLKLGNLDKITMTTCLSEIGVTEKNPSGSLLNNTPTFARILSLFFSNTNFCSSPNDQIFLTFFRRERQNALFRLDSLNIPAFAHDRHWNIRM